MLFSKKQLLLGARNVNRVETPPLPIHSLHLCRVAGQGEAECSEVGQK